MEHDRTELRAILAEGRFENLVGWRENDFFEAKGRSPYDLSSPNGRYELAKDISAFANAQGGWLIIGLTHGKLDAESTEEVTGIELMEEGDFPSKQIAGVLKSHICPTISGLQIEWKCSSSSSTQALGLGYVFVPEQSEDQKYFLITKVVENGVQLKEIVYGIARRVKADNVPVQPNELARYIREGRAPMAQRLTRLEQKVDRLLDSKAARPITSPAEQLEHRVRHLLS